MGQILQNIKRRLLLGGSRSRRAAAAEAGHGAAAAASPPATSIPPPSRPATWSPMLQQRAGQVSAESTSLALKSPRHVPLGALPAELAALEQRFAALPAHRSPSKEQLQMWLLAARLPALVTQDGHPLLASKQTSRSPCRLAKGARRPGPRAPLRKQLSETGQGSLAEWKQIEYEPAVAASDTPLTTTRLEPEQQQQRQSCMSGNGLPSAAPGSSGSGGPPVEPSTCAVAPAAGYTQNSEVEQADQQEAGWYSAHERPLAARLTPTVLAAAAQRTRPPHQQLEAARMASGGGDLESTQHHDSGSNSRSSGDLGLTLAPWDSLGAVDTLPAAAAAGRGSDARLPELPQRQLSGGHRLTPPLDRLVVGSASRSPLLLPRPPRGQLPPDLLSLRESASLARMVPAARLPLNTRRAVSVQEWAASGDEPAAVGSSAEMPSARLPNPPREAASAGASAKPPSLLAPPPGELSQGAKRLAALRRQRRSQWLSDFGISAPSWRTSRDGNVPSLLPPLATVAESGPSIDASSSAGQAAESRSSTFGPAGHLQAVVAVAAARLRLEPAAAAPAGEVAQAAEDGQPAAAQRPRGITHAQLRQQEAWGSLAGLSLGEILQQVPKERQPGLDEEAAAGNRENLMAHSNGSSPTSSASSPTAVHLQASPKPYWEQQLWQGWHKTVPNPSFVESLEMLAALHRTRSDSEQQDGSIQWRLPAPQRRLPEQQDSAGTWLLPLPGAHAAGSPAVQLHELRIRAGAGHLANSRRRGSQQHTTETTAEQQQEQQHLVVGHGPVEKAPALDQSPVVLPDAASTLPYATPVEQQRPRESSPTRPPVELAPPQMSQLPQQASLWSQQPQQQQSPPEQHVHPGQARGGMQAAAQQQGDAQHLAGQQGWYSTAAQPAVQVTQSAQPTMPLAETASWWQQQQQGAAYAQAQRQYVAHLAAQQGQQLLRQQSQHQQQLLRQQSLPQQVGSGRRKWQAVATAVAGHAQVHVAPEASSGAYIPSWAHQQEHTLYQLPQHPGPAYGQPTYWYAPVAAGGQAEQQQMQQRTGGGYMPTYVSQATVQHYHSGGFLQ